MSSVSFDPVAHVYDATRGYPEDVASRIANAIDTTVQANAQTAFLELGVGTGRIALPIADLGRTYTGIDISGGMLAQLETKLQQADWHEHDLDLLPWGSLVDEDTAYPPVVTRFTRADPPSSFRLVRGDIGHLPFRNASFDVVIAVHIFHLVSDWRLAVSEALRVLRPGGWLLCCRDGHQEHISGRQNIKAHWRTILEELHAPADHTRATQTAITQWLNQQGLHPEERQALTWDHPFIPSEVIEQIAQRSWSSSWNIPDALFDESIVRLRAWADETFGDQIDSEQSEERRFLISKTRKR